MSGISYLTTCKLCGQPFTHTALAEIAASNQQKAGEIMQAFSDHIRTKHEQEFANTIPPGLMLSGLLRFNLYDSQDLSALQMRDMQRYQLMEALRKNRVPDNKIVEQVSALGLPDEYEQRVIKCMLLMRDIIEERGPFTPRLPQALTPNPTSKSKKVIGV